MSGSQQSHLLHKCCSSFRCKIPQNHFAANVASRPITIIETHICLVSLSHSIFYLLYVILSYSYSYSFSNSLSLCTAIQLSENLRSAHQALATIRSHCEPKDGKIGTGNGNGSSWILVPCTSNEWMAFVFESREFMHSARPMIWAPLFWAFLLALLAIRPIGQLRPEANKLMSLTNRV